MRDDQQPTTEHHDGDDALDSLLRAAPAPRPPESLRRQTLAAIDRSQRRWRRRRVLATAAALLLAVFGLSRLDWTGPQSNDDIARVNVPQEVPGEAAPAEADTAPTAPQPTQQPSPISPDVGHAPKATVTVGGDAIAVPIESPYSNVTIVKVYQTVEAQRFAKLLTESETLNLVEGDY